MYGIIKPRYFNTITILSDDLVSKESEDTFKMKAEYEWFQNSSCYKYTNTDYKLGIWIPGTYDYWDENGRAGYLMDYIHGYTLSHAFVEGNPDIHLYERMLIVLESLLSNIPAEKNVTPYMKMCIHSMYEDKTFERLAKTSIDIDKEYVVNDYYTPTIREIIKNCPVYLKDENIKHIHGDLCFSNMIFAKYQKFRPDFDWVFLIDPRGYIPEKQISQIGDINYDVAKLAHSILGRYDQIQSRGFDIAKIGEREYTWSIRTSDNLRYIEDSFKDIFKNYDYFNIMIHLFLSMIPLHKDDPWKQEKMLVNALRLYLEKENRF